MTMVGRGLSILAHSNTVVWSKNAGLEQQHRLGITSQYISPITKLGLIRPFGKTPYPVPGAGARTYVHFTDSWSPECSFSVLKRVGVLEISCFSTFQHHNLSRDF